MTTMDKRLEKRMIQDMRLNGLSQKTQESYLNAVTKLINHYQKTPRRISSEELRRYFVRLMETGQAAPATLSVYRAGIRFLVEKTLGKRWDSLSLFRWRRPKTLPDILTVEEVKTILDGVRMQRTRLCLKTIYACGLRVSEAVALTAGDIDGSRLMLKVSGGKGRKDRYVPIPEALLKELRDYWKACRPTSFLFFGLDKDRPVRKATIQKTFKLVLREVGITKKVSVHTLRHSYATHLLDGGVGIRTIQEILGHSSLETTMIYTHLSDKTRSEARSVVNALMTSL